MRPLPTAETAALERFLDHALGDRVPTTVTPMTGGGSCEIFALDRGPARWVLRRAPRHASSDTAHDVLREFRILDAIKDEPVSIARPVVACADATVFGSPFYVMERIDGRPILQSVPGAWASAPETHGRALEELVDALVAIHAVDWRACGLDDMARTGDRAQNGDYLARQLTRRLAQLDSYGGRDLPGARAVAAWLDAHRPPAQPFALCHGDYKLDNVLFAPEPPPRLLAVVDWEMAAIGDPLVDLAWALIFHPGPEGTMRLGLARRAHHRRRAPAGPPRARRAVRDALGPGPVRTRLVRRVRALEARRRAGGQLREVRARTVRQTNPRILRVTGRSVARERRRRDRQRSDHLMRAWQVQGTGEPIDVLHEIELEPPEPGPGQIRIRVTAAGIGLPDVFMCRGTYPLTPPLPFVSGQEATGVVTALGEGVDCSIGDHIMCVTAFWMGHGSFAEECLVATDSVFPIPDGLTDAEAAGFWIPHLTAWTGLVDRGRLQSGDALAVLGAAGGSGIAAVQLGRALGARVIAVVSNDERAEFCLTLGADATVNHRNGALAAALRDANGGRGIDLVYDPVGGTLAEESMQALGRNGRLLAVGFASGAWPRVAAHDLVVTNTSLVGVFAGGYTREELDAIHANLTTLVRNGRLRNAVSAEIPFAELPAALQRMADRAVVGKLVVVL